MNDDITEKLNALTAGKSNWREKVKKRSTIDKLNEWFDSLSDKELIPSWKESTEGMPDTSSFDEWWEQFKKENESFQSVEDTDKWWDSLTEEERQKYLLDLINHI